MNDTVTALAEAFLRWPLPHSVCTDRCATQQGDGRVGTNLLSFTEARQMMEEVVIPRYTVEMHSLVVKNAELRSALAAALPTLEEVASDEVVFWGSADHPIAKDAAEVYERAKRVLGEDKP